ncbi:MAG: hypothetical protein AB7V55_00170 [Oscillospiraceae bacterium]
MLDVILAYLALLGLCVFFSSLPGVKSGLSPLLAVSACMLYFALAGILGVLVVGGWVFYFLCAALLGVALWRRHSMRFFKRLASPGLVFFAGFGLLLLVWLAVRQPVFREWDEFTFWGTAVKLMKLNGELYTTAPAGWWWTSTQAPALPMFSYFAQFFAPAFAAWKVFWAYDLVLLAAASALLGGFKWRHWRVVVPLGAVGVLTPFFFNVFYHTTYLNTTYISAYADVPAGMLFGGVLAAFFALRRLGHRALWQAALPLAALALVKDGNVLAIALVAAGVMLADVLVFGSAQGPALGRVGATAALTATQEKRRMWLCRVGAGLGLLVLPVAVNALWSAHTGLANAQNLQMAGEITHLSVPAALVLTVKELLGIAPRSDAFNQTAQNLWDSFLGRMRTGAGIEDGVVRVSMAGTALATCLLIVALFVLAAVLARSARFRRRVLLAGGLLLGGFLCYQFVMLVFYAHLYHAQPGSRPIFDYARYLQSYLVGWFLAGAALLGRAAKAPARWALPATAGVLALALAMLLRTGAMVRPGYSVLDYPASFDDEFTVRQSQVRQLAEHIEPGARVFYVCQGGDGGEWFRTHYEMLPVILDYSISGGGSLPLPADVRGWDAGQPTLMELAAYLEEQPCRYILIEHIDEAFIEAYAPLFEQPPVAGMETPALYHRADGAQGLYVRIA